ncbi:MAG: hypothetical protein DRP64_01445 [Verrucomicrobia bacterium]|nr:MAG: hypothetical protein DRP64_01445 [Verrucomicrobiota bacterium]
MKKIFILLFAVLVVSMARGASLFKSDFSDSKGWNREYGGDWRIENGTARGKTRSIWSGDKGWENYAFTTRARCLEGGGEGQVWLSFRYADEWNRYAIAIRGGLLDEVALFRYREGGYDLPSVMCPLNIPLGFDFEENEWYDVKVEVNGGNIRVWVGDVDEPQIDYVDDGPILKGAVALGGNYHLCEFDDVSVDALETTPTVDKADSAEADQEALAQAKELKRSQQRKDYQPVVVEEVDKKARTEVSLNGNWLFMPEQDLAAGSTPESPDSDDQNWHVMNVPNFWNQITLWTQENANFGLRGQDMAYRYDEIFRTEKYTFDYGETKTAWYRQWIDIPESAKGRRIMVKFDASASLSSIYINGHYLGDHLGMFTPFEFDVTNYVKLGGENLLAAHVSSGARIQSKGASDKAAGVAISMTVSDEMLNSLPKGMYRSLDTTEDYHKHTTLPRPGGIWQPVMMYMTAPVVIENVFFKPNLGGAEVDVTVENPTDSDFGGEVGIHVAGKKVMKKIFLEKNSSKMFTITTKVDNPRLWTPETPNLYKLSVALLKNKKQIDDYSCNVGFRTFEAKETKFYLNGRQRWMGGANHPPHGLRPNDEKLANEFLKLMHDGNQMITRSHGSPFTPVWADAADKQGVAVSLEGTWPWVGLYGAPMPEGALREAWFTETIDMVKQLRNHPSIVMWTVGNELNYDPRHHKDSDDPDGEYLSKMQVLNELMKRIRETDPTRPVCIWSHYIREKHLYEPILKPNAIDDGDITDPHWYCGWYGRSVFHDIIYNGGYLTRYTDQARMSQEASTGYPNNDTGGPQRLYIQMYVPQTWIGDEAFEHRDPAPFMEYHALISKEWMEDVRRTRRTAGWQAFANVCWFKNVTFADEIQPYPVYFEMKKALQPVLVSLDQRDRHCYQGNEFSGKIVVVNDDTNGKDLQNLTCTIHIENADGKKFPATTEKVKDCRYSSNSTKEFSFVVPENITDSRMDCKLVLTLKSGMKTVGQNDYKLLVAAKEWVALNSTLPKNMIAITDQGDIAEYLKEQGIKSGNIGDIGSAKTILWTKKEVPSMDSEVGKLLGKHVESGGTLVLLETAAARNLVGDRIIMEKFKARYGNVAFANIECPDHLLFEGFNSQDLRWWNGNGTSPEIAKSSYVLADNEKTTRLCEQIPRHGYGWKGPATYPMFVVEQGKGKILVSELSTSVFKTDPLAGKMLGNIIEWAAQQ